MTANTVRPDPLAAQFADDLLRKLGGNRDHDMIRLALLMAYTAGYRDAVYAETERLRQKIEALDAQTVAA